MTISDQDTQLFVTTLKNYSGYDFSDYSGKSLNRRLAKVLMDNKMDIYSLNATIRKDQSFLEKVVKDITVNTTELFRDPQIWHSLKYKVLPKFKNHKTINIWHAGCSTGQEVYSMLILLSEMNMLDRTKVYATDLNADVLEAAKKGTYRYRFNIGYLDNFDKVIKENPYNYDEFNDVPYSKYFSIDKSADVIRMNEELTKKPVFRKHDLVKDINIFYLKFDIIFCRNVIIYFNYDLQNRVFRLFHENLYNGGVLVMGAHETILGPYTAYFERNNQVHFKNEI